MDLVQSEYGWLDEVVMETPVCRLRQIVANIGMRRKNERLREQTIAEWQTKTLAAFIAATVPIEKKGEKNMLLEEALKITLRLDGEEEVSEKDVPPEVFIEKGSQVAHNNSHERLKAAFGA